MAYLSANRVKEATAAIGAGPMTLGGAVSRFRSFAAAGVTPGTTFSYAIDVPSGPWEVGVGTMGTDGRISRALEDSSTGGLLVLSGEPGTTVSLVTAASTVTHVLANAPAAAAQADPNQVLIVLTNGTHLSFAALLAQFGLTAGGTLPVTTIPVTSTSPTLVDTSGSALVDSSGRRLIIG